MTGSQHILNVATAGGSFKAPLAIPGVGDESTYRLAKILMSIDKYILKIFGLDNSEEAVTILYAILVVGISIIIGAIIKWGVLFTVRKISNHSNGSMMKDMIHGNVFIKLSRIFPPLVIVVLIQFAFSAEEPLIVWFVKFVWIYIVFCVARAINALIYVVWLHIDERENKKRLPLKGLIQLLKGIIWIIVAIIAVSIIVNKSPMSLLAGLGAFAAVLMLVFKDSILGVVAGVQLSENDVLRVGDWIKVDGTSANGTVTEVTLTAVKVLNWDKTTTTLPPYSLVSGSFQNYRTMQSSNTRRIQRCYYIDADTVRFTTPEMLEEFKKIPFMEDFINKKLEQKAAGKVEDVNNSDGLPDGSIDTNLGLFRAYVKLYLQNDKNVSQQDTCFVNTLQQTSSGIPFQIYCFTSTSSWIPYESIQSNIFEHIAAVLPMFKLYAFENPSSRDTVNEGYLEASGDPKNLYGLPYPFMPGVDDAPGVSPFDKSVK